jgi:glycosyltransferase involved in cell wall biosynthesis
VNASIIIPVFNPGPSFIKCLNAILETRDVSFEVIVIDDGSLVDPLTNFDKTRITYHRCATNSGQAMARNIGASLASGDVFIFIDSDVIIEKSTIRTCLEELYEKNVDAINGIISPALSAGTNLIGTYKNCYMEYFISRSALNNTKINFVHGSFIAIKKKSFIPWPPFKEYGEDTLYGKSLFNDGKKIRFSTQVRIGHLKNYGLLSLMRNAFLISRGWMIIAKSSFMTNSGKKSFFHAGHEQILSILFSYLFIATLFIKPLTALAAMAAILFLNAIFFIHILTKYGFRLFFISLLCLPLEYLSMSFGVISGLINNKSVAEKEQVSPKNI